MWAANWHEANEVNRPPRTAGAIERQNRSIVLVRETDRQDRVVTVEKAVAVVMQESGRRALFDATQRLGANYREKAGLIKTVAEGRS